MCFCNSASQYVTVQTGERADGWQTCRFSCWVRTGPGKPGKSWNFIMAFSRTGKSWKNATGPGKFWKSAKLN